MGGNLTPPPPPPSHFPPGNLNKWLFAPKGCGFMYVHPKHHAWIEPILPSLRMGHTDLHQRFYMTGTRDYSAFFAITEAISFHKRLGGLVILFFFFFFKFCFLKSLYPSFKPEIRLRAKQPSSEHMNQSDGWNYFGTRSCVRASLVSVYSLIYSFKHVAATLKGVSAGNRFRHLIRYFYRLNFHRG